MSIVIVNEQDEPIGLKERNSLQAGDIHRVTALWITNTRGEVLLAQRGFSKNHDPGKWSCAVSGTVDEGEDYDDNIVKEIKEELGIDLAIGDLKRDVKLLVKGRRVDFFCQYYKYQTDRPADEFVIPLEEVAALKWMPKDEVLARLKTHPDEFILSAPQWLPKVA